MFCFDGDNAGRTAAWRALENMLPIIEDGLSVRFMFLPDGEDPDSLLRQHGREKFFELLRQAQPLSSFLLAHLRMQTDIDTPDGRSRLAKLAEPFITQIPGKLFQQTLIIELAKLTQLDTDALRQLFGLGRLATPTRQSAPSFKIQPSGTPTLLQQIIALILQYPNLVQTLTNDMAALQALELAGADILCELLDLLQRDPTLTTGALVEHWRDSPMAKPLALLAMRELLLPEADLTAELHGLIAKLQQHDTDEKLSKLQAKALNNELSMSEKQAYLQQLIEQKK